MNTPEHDKLSARREEHGAVSDFLEWLGEQEPPLIVGEGLSSDDFGNAVIDSIPPEDLVARYFEVDPAALEAEKVALLAELREKQERPWPEMTEAQRESIRAGAVYVQREDEEDGRRIRVWNYSSTATCPVCGKELCGIEGDQLAGIGVSAERIAPKRLMEYFDIPAMSPSGCGFIYLRFHAESVALIRVFGATEVIE